MTVMIFPSYWECHHPNWRTHIFQRGRYTTKLFMIIYVYWMKTRCMNSLLYNNVVIKPIVWYDMRLYAKMWCYNMILWALYDIDSIPMSYQYVIDIIFVLCLIWHYAQTIYKYNIHIVSQAGFLRLPRGTKVWSEPLGPFPPDQFADRQAGAEWNREGPRARGTADVLVASHCVFIIFKCCMHIYSILIVYSLNI